MLNNPVQGGPFNDCCDKLLPEYTTVLGCMTALVLPSSTAELFTITNTKPRSMTCLTTLYNAVFQGLLFPSGGEASRAEEEAFLEGGPGAGREDCAHHQGQALSITYIRLVD